MAKTKDAKNKKDDKKKDGKKKDDKKMDAKNKKGGKKIKDSEPTESVVDETLLTTIDLEPEPEEIQFTDTSYTSASFESLPPPPEDTKIKKKKKKKLGDISSSVIYVVSSEVLRWSEESLKPPYAHLILAPKVAEEPEKKKKGKKGKKKVEEDIPEFVKPKSWKKMHKKEKEAWMLQKIEDWRAEQEIEKQIKLAGAKEKRAQLARERVELMAKEAGEQEIRSDLLQKAVNLFLSFEKQKMNDEHNKSLEAEWQQYIRCDGLPDPRIVTELNTFLHVWQQNEVVDDDELDRKIIQVLPILEMLESFRENNRQFTKRQTENYDEIRLQLRAQLALAIEMASYTLLQDLEKNLVYESTKVSTYQREFKDLKFNIWVAIKWPTRKPRPMEPDREPVELCFPSLKVTVILPNLIDASSVCVRAARSMIDLLSESSRSFALKFEMPKRYEDLYTFNANEMIASQKLKKLQEEARTRFYKETRDKIRELDAFVKANVFLKIDKEKEELDNLNMAEPPFMPRPREQIAFENDIVLITILLKNLVKAEKDKQIS